MIFFLIDFYSLDKVSFCPKENVSSYMGGGVGEGKRQNTGFPHFSILPRGNI